MRHSRTHPGGTTAIVAMIDVARSPVSGREIVAAIV
jgi:hypothetical protein